MSNTADVHDAIVVTGANENNLKDVSVEPNAGGPGAGSAGGRVVAKGTVREVVDTHERAGSATGRYLSYAADL